LVAAFPGSLNPVFVVSMTRLSNITSPVGCGALLHPDYSATVILSFGLLNLEAWKNSRLANNHLAASVRLYLYLLRSAGCSGIVFILSRKWFVNNQACVDQHMLKIPPSQYRFVKIQLSSRAPVLRGIAVGV
jgi:hypothetical protein